MVEAGNLGEIIQNVRLISGEDEVFWALNQHSYFVKLASKFLLEQSCEVEWAFIWKIRVPSKIKIFLWKVHLKILHTNSFLVSKNIIDKASSLCSICQIENETTDHLLLECDLAQCIWKYLF